MRASAPSSRSPASRCSSSTRWRRRPGRSRTSRSTTSTSTASTRTCSATGSCRTSTSASSTRRWRRSRSGWPACRAATRRRSSGASACSWRCACVAGQQLAARLAGGGREGLTVAWLLVLTPVVVGAAVRTHFDPLPIAIALAGLLALSRERRDLGFVLLGIGTMTKLFPGLLAVIALAWLLGRGEWRARAARRRDLRRGRDRDLAAAVGRRLRRLVSVSPRPPGADRVHAGERAVRARRLGRHRHEPAPGPLQVKRPGRRPRRGRRGAVRAAASSLAVAAIVLLAARRPDPRHMVLCGFAALLAFVTLGKVFSPQYVIWLAPFAALAWVWGRRAVALLTAAAIVLTHVEFPSRYFDLINVKPDVVWIVGVRNALLLSRWPCSCSGWRRAREGALIDGRGAPPIGVTFRRLPDDAPIEKKPLPTGGICHLCKHLDRNAPVGMRCAAFQFGIPFTVRVGVFDHRQPASGRRRDPVRADRGSRRRGLAPGGRRGRRTSAGAQRAGSRICSIASAFIGSEQRHEHAHEPRVLVGGLVALVHVASRSRGSTAPCARR